MEEDDHLLALASEVDSWASWNRFYIDRKCDYLSFSVEDVEEDQLTFHTLSPCLVCRCFPLFELSYLKTSFDIWIIQLPVFSPLNWFMNESFEEEVQEEVLVFSYVFLQLNCLLSSLSDKL